MATPKTDFYVMPENGNLQVRLPDGTLLNIDCNRGGPYWKISRFTTDGITHAEFQAFDIWSTEEFGPPPELTSASN